MNDCCREVKNNRDNEYEDFDAKSDIFGGDSSIDNILDSQAMEESEKINFVAGDQVLVASGELKGIEGKVCSVDEVNGLVRIALMHSEISNEVTVEANLLIKNIKPGAHVKVVLDLTIAYIDVCVCVCHTAFVGCSMFTPSGPKYNFIFFFFQ